MTLITSDTLLLHTDRHARVTAGPGAGKTHWLAEHIKNVTLRSKKLHSHAKIAVISYTNIAADALKQKLGSDAARTNIGTIHSFLYQNVLKPYLHLIKNTEGQPLVNTSLMDGHDEHHVNHKKVQAWLKEINQRVFDADQFDLLKKALEKIRWVQADEPQAWNLEIELREWLKPQLWNSTKAVLATQHLIKYKAAYWADAILDHDDVLYFATRILREYPLIASCLSARYPFLFIDEFQDTVPAQTNIVRSLADQGTTVVVIGDAEQSIFAFAGARPEHFRTFALPDLDEFSIANNWRSTDRIIALLDHVRSDELIQHGVRAQEGEPVQLIVGTTADAVLHAESFAPDSETLLVVARTRTLVQEAQQPTKATKAKPWDAVDKADSDRKILLHQLLAGIVVARRHRYDTAVRTILRGIRHTNGKLKGPFQSGTPRLTQQRRAIAIILLEALVALGQTLDTMTLRAAYDHCRTTLTNSFHGLTLIRSISGAFFQISEQFTCDTLLRAVKLTNNEEVRDARTIHQAKGTERQNVLVCLKGRTEDETQEQINHVLHPAQTSDEQQRVTYVAISRARDLLFLATPALTAAQELRARELGLTVIRLDTI